MLLNLVNSKHPLKYVSLFRKGNTRVLSHKTTVLESALARYKRLEEGEVTGQLFGRLSFTLMSHEGRCLDALKTVPFIADCPFPQLD